MAELKGNVLGNISGKVGTVFGRVRDGKNFLVSLPSSFNTPNDPSSIARREKFKMAVLFAKAVNANPLLKSIWDEQNTEKRTVFNLVMQKNYKLLENNSPSDFNIISPEYGFNPNYSSAEYLDGTVTIVTNPLDQSVVIDPAVETKIAAVGFIYADDPSSDIVEIYHFYNFGSVPQAIVTDVAITFTADLSYSQRMQLESYQSIKIYSSLITLTDEETPVKYSLTAVN